MRSWRWAMLVFVGTAVAQFALPTEPRAAELDEAECRRLHGELQPSPDEPWRTIPWKIGLLDAQRVAAEEKKPIFIWAMDGHPLGCT